MQTIPDRFVDEWVIRHSNLTDEIVSASCLIRKHRGQEIIGSHALYRWRYLSSACEAQDGERTRRIPPPPGGEHWRVEQRLGEYVFNG